MNQAAAPRLSAVVRPRSREQAHARTVVLGLACFLAGLAAGALWVERGVSRRAEQAAAQAGPQAQPPALPPQTAAAAQAGPQAQPLAVAPPTDGLALEEVRRAIPNLDSVSLEAGTRLLREAAVSEFGRAAQEMEARLRQARQNLLQAQSNHAEAQEQAALKQLQQVQAEQADKLKQIAARSQAQIQALTRLKAAGH